MKNRKILNIELGRYAPAQYKTLPESGIHIVLHHLRRAHTVGRHLSTAYAAREHHRRQ